MQTVFDLSFLMTKFCINSSNSEKNNDRVFPKRIEQLLR